MTMGKKTSRAAIIILDSELVMPNQLLMMGAIAMSGIVEAPIATGSRMSRASAQRAEAKPMRIPAAAPMTSPPIASQKVLAAESRRAPEFLTAAAQMDDGGGMTRRPSPPV